MKKNIQPEMNKCEYSCAACGAKYNVLSTKHNTVSLDVCANCHPFYIGSTTSVGLKGRAEKLSSKFETGKQFKPTKKEVNKAPKKEKKSNIKSTLKDL